MGSGTRAPRRRPVAALLIAAAGLVSTATAAAAIQGGEPAGTPPAPRPVYEAECVTGFEGSTARARCHNPYPVVDRVRLHIECDRWWDLDVESAPVEIGPAQTAEITGRCWLPVNEAWVTHDVDSYERGSHGGGSGDGR